MFNIFKHRTVGDLMNEATANYKVPPAPPRPQPFSTCHYTVGTTTDGMTVLKVGATTLTLNEVGTHQLIRMLVATLPEGDL